MLEIIEAMGVMGSFLYDFQLSSQSIDKTAMN